MRHVIQAGLLGFLMMWSLKAAIDKPLRIEGGLVSGVRVDNSTILSFKGIPYAASPVGPLRWRAPQPVVAWQGVRSAARFSASCIQHVVPERKPWTYEFMTHGEMSEDCLYLNVWTGAQSAAEKRPVFVYIYGGGFSEGSASVPVYNGESLAKKGLVVVTINYRVGVFGFLAHQELTQESTMESDHQASGNYGLLDQLAALRWIQQNITDFGGDVDRVTIAGQSAGGISVHDLIASPLAKGLFARAIVESGGSGVGNGNLNQPPLTAAQAQGQNFAEMKGAQSIAELRRMSWQKLLEASSGETPGGRPALRFGPIVDGYFLPAPYFEMLAQGRQNDVVTLTGANQDELGGLGPPLPVSAQFISDPGSAAVRRKADEFLKLYPAGTDEEAMISQARSVHDQALVSMYFWAQVRARTARTKVYEYLWDHPLPGPDALRFGAFHSSEVPYVLNTLAMSDRPFTEADRKIAERMASYWANFAANGDPNGTGLPVWPEVSTKPQIMEVGDTNGPIPIAGSPEKLQFFESVLKN